MKKIILGSVPKRDLFFLDVAKIVKDVYCSAAADNLNIYEVVWFIKNFEFENKDKACDWNIYNVYCNENYVGNQDNFDVIWNYITL